MEWITILLEQGTELLLETAIMIAVILNKPKTKEKLLKIKEKKAKKLENNLKKNLEKAKMNGEKLENIKKEIEKDA